MSLNLENNIEFELGAGVLSGTSLLTVKGGKETLLPAAPFRLTVVKFSALGTVTYRETMLCTDISSNVLEVMRAYEPVPDNDSATELTSIAHEFDEGDIAYLSVTAGMLKAMDADIENRLPRSGGLMTGQLELAKGADIASATTTDIGAATGNYAHITGTTTITSLGSTAQPGCIVDLVFYGILILTHNATSLILPTSANITTAAGDTATFVCESAGNWKCAMYQRASGQPLAAPTIPDIHGRQLFTASGTFNVPAGVSTVYVSMCGGGGGGGGYRGAGGGGAASVFHQSQAVTPGAAITVTIGAAGTAGGAPSPTATAGGNSSFGAFITTNGGGFGAYATGAGGAAGGTGGTPGQIGNGNEGAGKGGDGGSCHFGRGGSAEYRSSATNGGTSQAGSGFGAGGAGGPWNGSGMAGSPGMCLLEW